MWGQAFLAGDLVTFYKRLKILTTDYGNLPLSEKLSVVINKHVNFQRKMPSNNKPVAQANYYIGTKIDNLVVSIRAFLDGLLAYHCPYNTFLKSSEYNKIISNSILKTSTYVTSGELTCSISRSYGQKSDITYKENFPLLQVYNEPLYGSILEYTDFFQNLITKCINSKYHFYILLGSINHSIALSFENGYLLVYDANNMHYAEIKAKSLLVTTPCSYEKLSCEVFNSFSFNNFSFNKSNSNLLALNVSIYINPKHYKHKNFIYGQKAEEGFKKSLDLRCYRENLVNRIIKQESWRNDYLFWLVCQNGHKDIAELLVGHGADINFADKDGLTPLSIICQNGHVDIVQLLLARGANPNIASNSGKTPLFVACQKGHTDIVELLLTCENLNTSPQMVSQYFSGGCDRDSNNMILTSLKNVFPWFNINTVWSLPLCNGGILVLTPLIYACQLMDNRSISWLLESYKGSIRDTVISDRKNALEWYLIHQSQPGYDLQIEQELKKLPR